MRVHSDTFCTNPQYVIKVVDPDEGDEDNTGTIIVALMQKERRKKKYEGLDMLVIGYCIYKVTATCPHVSVTLLLLRQALIIIRWQLRLIATVGSVVLGCDYDRPAYTLHNSATHAREPIMHPPTKFQKSRAIHAWLRYCKLIISNLGAVRHLGFDQKWIWTIPRPPETNSVSTYQISTKSGNAPLR